MRYFNIVMAIAILTAWMFMLSKMHHNNIILKENISVQEGMIDQLQLALTEMQARLNKRFVTKATVTFYHPWSEGINSDDDPYLTATMTVPMPGRTVAVSTELVEEGWLGRKVYINGYGVFRVEDRMRPSLKGRLVDICVATRGEAMKNGRVKNVTVFMLGE